MEQKEVKIIALKVNERFGILQSFECEFDPANNLIAIKGEVGSGKTTFHKSLELGTKGSETLKDDKQLYGAIDQEVQLLDGEIPIFVGCKSDKKGALTYVIYTKDDEGKVVKDPVVDGVKLTPSVYLKSLQTALTWRMDELTSENPTVQKKLLLELYKIDLAKIGVIFDKTDEKYSDSILGKIESAEADRANKDYARKQVGGFRKHLEPLGIDVDMEGTWPKRQDVEEMEREKNKLGYDLENINGKKKTQLDEIQVKVDGVYVKLRVANEDIKEQNRKLEAEFDVKHKSYGDSRAFKNRIEGDLVALKNNGCLDEDELEYVQKVVDETVTLAEPARFTALPLIPFDDGKCTVSEFGDNIDVNNLLIELKGYKESYLKISSEEDKESGESIEKEIELKGQNITLAKENNKKCDAVQAFEAWREANEEVVDLKQQYAKLLESVDTGLDGLRIQFMESETGKLDIYLTYNGEYDPEYFGNKDKEHRKLSSYSGTQKPLICLMLQNYLLSKKPKAMRYLWIDNVPIDKKTKALLHKMGQDLRLTIFVNITGDFNKEALESGDIFIEGGEVFFN